MRGTYRWSLVLGLMGGLLTAAGAAEGPGRIAVAGAFPNGYLGLLARHGLPRCVLADSQLEDPAALARFEVVIVAGLAGSSDKYVAALRQYVAQGGRVLLDYGPPPGMSLRGRGGPTPVEVTDGGIKASARSTSPLRLVGDHNPLLGVELTYEPPRLFGTNFAPLVEAEGAVVLAEFTATSPLAGGFMPDRPIGPRFGAFGGPGGEGPAPGPDGAAPAGPAPGPFGERPADEADEVVGGRAVAVAERPVAPAANAEEDLPFTPRNGVELRFFFGDFFGGGQAPRANQPVEDGPFTRANGAELPFFGDFGGFRGDQRGGQPAPPGEGPFNEANGAALPFFGDFGGGGQPGPGGPGGRGDRGPQQRDSGPAAPALVLETKGTGKLLHSGVSAGLAGVFGGVGYDSLVLGMLKFLSDGRIQPQLTVEGPQLRFGQSVSAWREAGGETIEPPAATVAGAEREAGPARPATLPRGYQLLDETLATDADITFTKPAGAVNLLLGYCGPTDNLRLEIGGQETKAVRATAAGLTTRSLPLTISANAPVTVRVRGNRLQILAGGHLARLPIDGLRAGSVAVAGGVRADYQPVEPVYFTDDFMRTSEFDGGWRLTGEWRTVAAAEVEKTANPFSLKVDAEQLAVARQGEPFWSDYLVECAVETVGGEGYVGLAANVQANGDRLWFRAKIGAPAADGLQLIRVLNGHLETLARATGALAPGQWYRLGLEVAEGRAVASLDGLPVLEAEEATLVAGGIELSAERAQARFDDVRAVAVDSPLPALRRIAATLPDGAGTIDLNSWAGPAETWEAVPDQAGLFWRRGFFHGDLTLSYSGAMPDQGGELALLLDADGQRVDSGIAWRLTRLGQDVLVELTRGEASVLAATFPVKDTVALALREVDGQVSAELDGQVLATTRSLDSQGRIGLQALGFRPRISSVVIETGAVADDTFATAPVDWWIGSGEWALTNRWSCSPEWSWFGGKSAATAAIWYKRQLVGDQLLDFYVGPKMDEEGTTRFQSERIADFNATLCGDGQTPDSGYSVIVGAADGQVELRRNGRVVARSENYEFYRVTGDQALDFFRGHNRWFNIQVRKTGARIEVIVEHQVVLTYDDPEPLEAGYAAVWTNRNGIMVPRISLYRERLGEPLLAGGQLRTG